MIIPIRLKLRENVKINNLYFYTLARGMSPESLKKASFTGESGGGAVVIQ